MGLGRRALVTGIAGALVLGSPPAIASATTTRYLTIKGLSRAGKVPWITAQIYDPASGKSWPVMGRDTAVAKLPDKRTYEIYATLARNEPGESPENTVVLATYKVSKGHDHVTLSAKGGRPIDVSVGDPSVQGRIRVHVRHGSMDFTTDDVPGRLYAVPVKRSGVTFTQGSTWTGPGVLYRLGTSYSGGIPAGVTQHVTKADLAQVKVTYRSFGDGMKVNPRCRGAVWGGDDEMWLDAPATLTEYVQPGAACKRELWYESSSHPLFGNVTLATRTYAKGTAPDETWNAAVFAPAAPGGHRTGDRLHYTPVNLLSDAAGNWGFDQFTIANVKLRAGAKTLALDAYEPDVTLGRSAATYHLDVTATRDAAEATLSDRVQVSWVFTSARTKKKTALPLTTVRFAPRGLDGRNAAAPGSTTEIPVRVVTNSGATAHAVRTLKVEASTDGSKTWQSLPVANGVASVTNPAGLGFVALRATVVDSAGSQVTETVSRAYRVAG
ncbi:hypothetical protein [Actinoallomurus rhizosphaericola]|uniref:hypothetical protein n=1 Tax=Actinoallomurus rhizosphaericola TaxID=2952536 RepID=UPI0020908381|nr:hypothetical protein [Actinoallomurus rhizosphaericola]MCO5994377.1 hypothetical protein [Actinoallomurus rhizosphaericola]